MLTAPLAADAHVDDDDVAPLLLRDVDAGYGRIRILTGVGLTVRSGAVTALIGPNGAGKTTALGVMSGLLRPWSGHRHVAGRHLNDATADELARVGICHVREGRSVFANLTVADNLRVAAAAGGSRDRLEAVAYGLFPRLAERRTQLAGSLSGGERQMLALARGLGVDPTVLLIDELSMGLAPLVVTELYEVVAEVARQGVAILVVEQFANVALQYADHAYVMAHGRVTFDGPSHEAADAVHAAYLGAS